MSRRGGAGAGIVDSRRWALTGATLIDPATETVKTGGLLIDSGTIVAVGPGVDRASLGDTPTVDATGRYVLPGLIDTHVHLAFDGGPRPIERYIEDGVDAGFSERIGEAAIVALRSGATTIRDLGGPNDAVFGLRARIADGQVVGPRLIASGLVLSTPAGHCHFIAQRTDGEGLAAAVKMQLAAGADCIKVMVTGGVHTPGSSSADVQYALGDLRAAVDVAHLAGRRITGHATNPTGIERTILAGFDSIQHGSALDEGLADLTADHGVALVPTLGTHAGMADHRGDPRIPRYVAAKAEHGMAGKTRAFRTAVAAGVTITAGTDGGVTFVGHGGLARELALFREGGLGPMATLAAATSIAATEVGLADRIGRLGAGYDADLIVLDADPVADIRALERPPMIISYGNVVVGDETPALAHAWGQGR